MSSEYIERETSDKIEDMDLTPSIPVFSNVSTTCVNVWIEKMNKGILSCTDFKKHWKIWVPKIYSPEQNANCLDWSFDEDKAQKILYNTLEEFICNGDPQVILKQLNQMDNPPSVCGKAFKMGEPTYSCRECSVDATCVLCVDCFKQSAHSTHKYKMGTSTGGGCCDCGDTEAWKKDPFCKVHNAGLQSKECRGNKLPGDIAERAVMTFEAVLHYCYEILSLEHTPGLPSNLCVKETDEDPVSLLATTDNYCTVLFNDETHTFEQVITTLTRVIKCSQRDAIEYVTIVDREGRAVVKCSGFQHCNELKIDVEKYTSRHNNGPLKVLVVHAHVIAHQMFAMKLLKWLQQFISVCEGFRVLFSNVALNTKLPEISIVEGILMRDSQLWKYARTAWHRLFISGMLTEYESKKALAIVFTRNYGSMMKDFIRDDHDYQFSIVSFSVQLFTVPTLTHYLIAHHEIFFILLNTFISEISRSCNEHGKLEFEKNALHTTFKRALHILDDLKYLLGSKPEIWTDGLRRGFLQGVSLLLKLFENMQCMDAVVRQVGQHMEYEPEWESAFTLHMKLSPIISLALEWCGSDRFVLIKALRLVFKKLYALPQNFNPGQVRKLADHSATCIKYDVLSEPVSLHLPLCRFLAGLFLYLEKYNLDLQYPEFLHEAKPTPEEIIEPVLTAQAMISQLHAGMWRRNGLSLVNQVFCYHSSKCSAEMLDRDVVLLQAGASLIESNEFLIHVLNKFNLLGWTNVDFDYNGSESFEEDSIRQTVNLAEEFLGLLITIIGERYVPGVGQVTPEDHLKKEIIQQLCIRPLSHSELNKALQQDVHQEPGLDSVIKEVADFIPPSQKSARKGLYKLKPHLYTEYNVFFYHYTKEESSRSEEVQRKYRKSLGELECCPPPKLPKLTKTFSLVANLLQCDVMLHIMKTVLERAKSTHFMSKRVSEMQVHKVLHLIGYALQEQESGHYPFLTFTERAHKWELYKLLSSSTNNPRIEAHKDLLIWILGKYREVAGLNAPDLTVSSPPPQPENNTDVKTDKEWRTKMAAQKREKIMAQMAAMQKHFMKENAKLFEETTLGVNKISDHGTAMDLSDSYEETCVALGINQTSRLLEELTFTCILCQENQAITTSGPPMVLAAFVQQSTVLCQTRPDIEEPDPLYLSAKLGATPHTSTCSHVMHVRCWEDYFENVLLKESRRPYRLRQPASFDIEKQEYLCPLCECLSNTVIPLLPPLGVLQPKPQVQSGLSFGTWLDALRLTIDRKSNKKAYKSENLREEHGPECRYCVNVKSEKDRLEDKSLENETVSKSIRIIHHELGDAAVVFDSVYGRPGPPLSEGLVSMIRVFIQATYMKGLGVEPHDGDSRVPLLAWKSTAYTIHTIEFLLRDQDKPLLCALSSRQKDCLIGLTKISAILGSTCFSNSSASPTWANRKTVATHAVSLLTMLLDNPHSGPSILDWDAFGVLIPLINSLPCLFSSKSQGPPSLITCGVLEYYALQLVFIALIVKILLSSDFNETMDVGTQETEKSNAESLLTLVQVLEIDVGNQTVDEIWKRIKEACMPFLRCCALYFHYASDVPAPSCLKTTEGATYENICSYLGLPITCDELIKPNIEIITKLIEIWKGHPTVQMHLSAASTVTVVKEPLKINKLVELPEDYSELINSILLFTCPTNDKEDSSNPTMCLVCGKMLCSQSYCCQAELKKTMVGACTYHASKCGTGVGIFLRVRDCEVVFLRSPNRGAFVSPPYLDEYGETDQGLRRGNPLRLCRERYKQLNETWLAHELYESVARIIESTNNVSTQWHHV